MIISINEEKVYDKSQRDFIKILHSTGIEGNYFHIIKDMYENPQQTSHTMVKDKCFL